MTLDYFWDHVLEVEEKESIIKRSGMVVYSTDAQYLNYRYVFKRTKAKIMALLLEAFNAYSAKIKNSPLTNISF